MQRIPQIVAEMRLVIDQNQCTGDAPDAAIDLYRGLPDIDFSRQILQCSESKPRVLRVDDCGWSDLGTPKRVADTLRGLPTPHEVEGDDLHRIERYKLPS